MPGAVPWPSSAVPLNMRGQPWRDQVPRRLAFEAAHPDVVISFLDTAWQAVIPQPAGEHVIVRYELSDLLDVLEARFAPP
jgi:hypothetical protein